MENKKSGIVYCLRSHNQPNIFYIGSTRQTLAKRLEHHIKRFKAYNNGAKGYYTAFEVLKCGNPYMVVLGEFQNVTTKDLHRYEGNFIKDKDEMFNGVIVNKVVAGRTKKEYFEDNKERIKIQRNCDDARARRFQYDNAVIVCSECNQEYIRKYKKMHVETVHEGKTEEQYKREQLDKATRNFCF